MKNEIALTFDAEDDLNNIWLYTYREWGETQADLYLDKLGVAFQGINCGDVISKPHHSIDPDLNSIHCEHHYIFYLKWEAPVIIAVLHERMDLMIRLRNRL